MLIRFVSGKGWDSKLIEWWSRVPWSHVELLFGDDVTFGAQFWGGVKMRSTKDRCYRKAGAYEVWDVPITGPQEEQLAKLMSDAAGARYDWLAILSFILGPHKLHLRGAWICSGFVAGVISSLNLLRMNLALENYEPRDIWMLVPQIPGARRIE